MKLNWDSLLEPIFLFILSLIAGTLWVIVPIQQNPPPVVQAAAPAVPPPAPMPLAAKPKPLVKMAKLIPVLPPDPELERLEKEHPLVQQTAQTVQVDAKTTAASLQSANEEQQRLAAAIQNERQRLDDLKKAANDSKQENRPVPPKLVEAERLEETLRNKKTEIAKLETELSNTHNPFEKQVTSLPKASPATKAPVLVELFHDHAIPLDKKHFHFTTKWKGPMLATRDSDGETLEEIKKPDSDFSKLLASIKPGKQYLACLLNDDSFEIFREIRTIAREKGVNVGWEPIDSSAGKITIYPIHFTSKPDRGQKTDNGKPLPRVTSIIE